MEKHSIQSVLAFDTSSEILSATLVRGEHIYQENRLEGLKHSEHLLSVIENLVFSAGISIKDLDLLVCSQGPGSFTGLRIGMATAKGLSRGSGVPLVSVPTLDFLVYPLSFFPGIVLPILNARKKRFYTAIYENGYRKGNFLDISAQEIYTIIHKYEKKEFLLTGPDAPILYNSCPENRTVHLDPLFRSGRSYALLKIGVKQYTNQGCDSPESGPFYLRKSEAEYEREKKHGRAGTS